MNRTRKIQQNQLNINKTMIVNLLIMLLVLGSSQNIQISIQFGHNTYSPIPKYFTSQQKVQITDMISNQDNKTYHFCYIQSLLNSDIIEQDCLKLFNTSQENPHCSYSSQTIGQKSTTTSPIMYKLNDIIQEESVLGTYYYQSTSVIKSGNKSEELRMKDVLVVKSKGVLSIRLDEKCLIEQQTRQSKQYQNNTSKCENIQSVVQLFFQQQASKTKFIELNNHTNNNQKQLLLLTQSHIYSIKLLAVNKTQSSQSINMEVLAKLEHQQQQQQQQEKQEEFTTFIIDNKDAFTQNEQTTTINLLLFTNKKNVHLYKFSASPTQPVKLYSKNISPLTNDIRTSNENKDLQLLIAGDVEGEIVYYNDGSNERGMLMIVGKSLGDVRVSADIGAVFDKYDHNDSTINTKIDNNKYTSQSLFYHLPNTHNCHKIHQYKHQYTFLECKNHLKYIKVKELAKCFNNQGNSNNIQQCLNSVKQSHLNLGFHIQSAHFPLDLQDPYLTITTLDKYSHFFIDYCQQTQQINSINNIATYYYSNQTLKTVYRTNEGRSIVLTKKNVIIVKQQQEENEIYCKTVDENSRRELGQPVGKFTGTVVVQGVCKDALIPNNDKLILQNIQNSTLCRYQIPTIVTITHTVNKYKSIWQVLLATGLTTTMISLIFCLIKSRKLKQIYNALEEEKEHNHKMMQGTVVTQINQSQEESIGVGLQPSLNK